MIEASIRKLGFKPEIAGQQLELFDTGGSLLARLEARYLK